MAQDARQREAWLSESGSSRELGDLTDPPGPTVSPSAVRTTPLLGRRLTATPNGFGQRSPWHERDSPKTEPTFTRRIQAAPHYTHRESMRRAGLGVRKGLPAGPGAPRPGGSWPVAWASQRTRAGARDSPLPIRFLLQRNHLGNVRIAIGRLFRTQMIIKFMEGNST